MTDNILEKLKAEITSAPGSSEKSQQKKLKLTIGNDSQEYHMNLLLELEEIKKKLVDSEYQKVMYSEIIIENKQRIIELEFENELLLSKYKRKINEMTPSTIRRAQNCSKLFLYFILIYIIYLVLFLLLKIIFYVYIL